MTLTHVLACVFTLTLAAATASDPEGRSAIAVLGNVGVSPSVGGTIVFRQKDPGSPVVVTGTITGLAEGEHGFHVHEKGNVTDSCKGAGGHFNPENKHHGAPTAKERHVGDLGNIMANNTGSEVVCMVNIQDSGISLYGDHSIVGRSIVVHDKRDDLGLTNHSESKTTGNAGSRVACGVIGIDSPVTPWNSGAGSVTNSLTTGVMSVLLVTLLKNLVM